MKFHGGSKVVKWTTDYIFGSDLGLLRCEHEQKNNIIVATRPDQAAGKEPEDLGLAFYQGPTFINAYCQAVTNLADQDWGVMICLCQGLRFFLFVFIKIKLKTALKMKFKKKKERMKELQHWLALYKTLQVKLGN